MIANLPGLMFLKNKKLQYIACSSRLNQLGGDNLIGNDDYNTPWANNAEAYRNADKRVMREEQPLTFLESLKIADGTELVILSRKFPSYDDMQQVSGITCSLSIVTSPATLRHIAILRKTDFELVALNNYQPKNYAVADHFELFNLSKSETKCLFYLIRGKTAKEIAAILKKSKRTIEKHIDSIKYKLNCKTKSSIIEKAIEYGFVHFIPSDFLIKHT
jgi:DNA-binding CsgD family transcriptional regulator